ncbi:MAG TPA: hypothetical protein VGJ44_12610 [Kribbellaceae bacterium]|jgi:hypothetical protein
MQTSRFERFLPISGVIAGLLFALRDPILSWGAPSVDGDAAGYVRWVTDHGVATSISGFAAGYFAVAMLFFAVALRQALRSGEPGESTYSSAAFAGGLAVALSVAVMGWVGLAATEAATAGNAAVVTTLGYISDFGWIPWVAGSAVLFLSTGLGGWRMAVLPKPLAIATVVLGILCLTGPTGIAVFLLTPVWLIVTGIVLHRRLSASSPAAAPGVRVRATA